MTRTASPVYRRHPDAVSADLGSEVAVLDMARGSYRGFNETAAFVWRHLETPATLDELCGAVTAEYEVTEAQCRQSLGKLLAELEQAGLVVSSDG